MFRLLAVSISLMMTAVCLAEDYSVEALDSASVSIMAEGGGQGSGSIILRELVIDDEGTTRPVAFVLTAAHVIKKNRHIVTRLVDGSEQKVVEFSDPAILQELTHNGRVIGGIHMKFRVIRYSDAEKGHDLAVGVLYAQGTFKHGVSFVEDHSYVPEKGTDVFLISSPAGSMFAGTYTSGVISQTGRLLPGIGGNGGVVFDTTTSSSMPGSSGGALFRKEDGRYVGMLVRGLRGVTTHGMIVPVRRIHDWAEQADIAFLFDESIEAPTFQEVLAGDVE